MVNETDIALEIKALLNSKLTDPRATAGGEARSSWCHTDMPLAGATYPRIQIKKIPSTNDIISIGTSYAERTFCYYNIYFYTKAGFKVTQTVNGVSTEINNENLVAYYLEDIKNKLKDNQATTQALGIDGFKKLGTSEIFFDSSTQLYYGYITCRYWYFCLS